MKQVIRPTSYKSLDILKRAGQKSRCESTIRSRNQFITGWKYLNVLWPGITSS
jgi:hypothetical protein